MLTDIKAESGAGGSTIMAIIGFAILGTVLFNWFATSIRENHQGLPSAQLKRSYVLGMYWFIFSEVMFFAAFFGALFYVRQLAIPWLGGEGGRGVSNMLWPEFQAVWPAIANPSEALFEPPHESMEWRGWGEALGICLFGIQLFFLVLV